MTKPSKSVDDQLILLSIRTLIEDIGDGKLQIPEFQRELRLGNDWTKSFLASISLGYSTGAVMLLEAGSPNFRFTSYPIPGATAQTAPPEWLVIDGQQRLTALYQAFCPESRIDTTIAAPIRYCVDIKASLDPVTDRDEAMIALIVDNPAESGAMFPLSLVFDDASELENWREGFIKHGDEKERHNREDLVNSFETRVIKVIQEYKIPIIILGQETTRWSVRVHGGQEGKMLSNSFSVSADSLQGTQ